MGNNDSDLRFVATLDDQASPRIDALTKKLKDAGATPAEIKMFIRAQDDATPHLQSVKKLIAGMPGDHTIRVHAASDQARAHMAQLKKDFREPIEVPLKFTDNLEEVGQRLFTLRTKYMLPMSGMIPGSNMLYGVGLGAGALGAVGGASDLLKRSIDINAELEQQNAALTQALKDHTGATQEMGRIMAMSGNSQFGRQDMTQADIVSRQFNLPSFAGESKYMPKGVIPTAQNLAAVGQTSVTEAATAIARATQGYFRQLLPYGISIRQEDFSPGGRFAGKSYEQAIAIATRRFEGAAQTQAKTFTGMLSKFHNMFEEKILSPLGAFTFDQFKGSLGNILGGAGSKGFEETISADLNKVQEGLSKFWNLVQKGKSYFQTNLQKPLEDIIKNIIQFGTVFASIFSKTFVGVLKTLAEGLMGIARPIASLINSTPQIAQFFGVMKALSLLGFKDISSPFVNPLKDLATLHFGSLLHDLTGIPGALAKISVFFIAKGFIDAHTAQKAVNDEFPKLKNNFDDINSKIVSMSVGLHESATHMKELVATAAHGLPAGMADSKKLALSYTVATAGAQLHNAYGISDMASTQAITQEMHRTQEYSNKAVREFGNELRDANAAAQALGFSFSDLQRIITQYASAANPVNLGGTKGAAALAGLQSGINSIDLTKQQSKLYPTRDLMLKALLQSYGQPSADDLQALGGNISSVYNFKMPTKKQMSGFFSNEQALLTQYKTATGSNRQAQDNIHRLAPDLHVPSTPVPGITDFIGMSPSALRGIRRDERNNNPQALGVDLAKAQVANVGTFKNINNQVQELQKNISGLTNKIADWGNAQARLNIDIQTFQNKLIPLQRQIQDQSLVLQKYTFETLHPLERQMTRLNEAIAENQHAMSNAQYDMSKWSQGLFVGEQAALNQMHALETYNKQLQLLQSIYQQIGAELGTTIYDQGSSVRVGPMSNFSLSMAQQIAQRKEQQASLKYDLNYGEKHYQVDQASRSRFQREELTFQQRMQHVKTAQGIIDIATQKQHDMDQVQFNLSRHMFHVNEKITDQSDAIQRLQLRLTSLQQSKTMRNFEDDARRMGHASAIAAIHANTLQQKMSGLQNIIDNLHQGKTNIGKLLQQTFDFTVGSQFDRAEKALVAGLKKKIIDPKQFTTLWDAVETAKSAAHKAEESKKQWYNNQTTFKTVLVDALKAAGGIFTGSTERNIVNKVQGLLHKIPGVGGILGNQAAGEVGAVAATAYVGLSTLGAARVLGRTALYRTVARGVAHIPGFDTHLAPRVARGVELLDRFRLRNVNRAIDRFGPEEDLGFVKRHRLQHSLNIKRDLEQGIKMAEEMQAGGEADIVKLTQHLTEHPFKRAGEKFRWVRRGRVRIGEGVGGAIGSFGGGILGGEPGAQAGELLLGHRGGKIGEETTIRDGIKIIAENTRKAADGMGDVKAAIESKRIFSVPSELENLKKVVTGGFKDAQTVLDQTRAASGMYRNELDAAKHHQSVIEASSSSTKEDKKAAADNVKAAEKQVKVADEARHIAREQRDAAYKAHVAAREQIDAAKAHSRGIAKDFKHRLEIVKNEHAVVRKFSEHVSGFNGVVREFGKKVGIFAIAVDGFHSIKDAIGKFFGKGPKGPHGGAPNKDAHEGREDVHFSDEHPHAVHAHVRESRHRLRGVFGKGINAFMAEGTLGGDPVSMGFATAAGAEQAARAVNAIKKAGGVKTALGEHVAEKYGKKLGFKTLSRLGAASALEVLAGSTPVVGQLYDAYMAAEALPNRNLPYGTAQQGLTPGRFEGHGANQLTGSAQMVEKMRLASASDDVKKYLTIHHTTLTEMEKIYARNGQLPKMFTDYFQRVAGLTQDQAKQDLDNLKQNNQATSGEMNRAFKQYLTDTKQNISDRNNTEDQGYLQIYTTTDNWLSKLTRRVKRTKKDLGLTHGTQNDASDQTGSADPTSTANAVKGAFASGGISVASARELAHSGGKLMKVSEEGPEMIIPLMPHRRDRAKNLVRQATGMLGMHFANGGFTPAPGKDFSHGEEPAIARDLAQLGRKLGINLIGISGYRTPAHSIAVGGFADDPHTRGEAADVGAPTREAFGRLVSDAALKAVGLYRPFGGAQEINHVQLLSGGAQGSLASIKNIGKGGMFNLPKVPKGLLRSGPVGSMIYGWMKILHGKWDRQLNKGLGTGRINLSGFTGGGDATANIQLGQRMAAAMGWKGKEFDDLRSLWTGESAWRTNVNSGGKEGPWDGVHAYGIPQALPPTKMGTKALGGDAAAQIAWGLNYIKQRYRDPSNAYSTWLSRSPHWYHKGSWNVGNQDDMPAVVKKGEMILPTALAAAVRGSVPHVISGHQQAGSRPPTWIDVLDARIKRIEQHLKAIKDQGDKKDEQKHLSDLNAALRLAQNQKFAAGGAKNLKAVRSLLKGDASDGEGTQALVDHEKLNFKSRIKGDKAGDQTLIKHISNLVHTAKELLKTAHTPHQKKLAQIAVHATQRAQKAGHRLQKFIGTGRGRRAQREVATENYTVQAAKRGVNARLLRSITGGKGLDKHETDLYKKVANTTGSAQVKAIAALRKDLTKHLSASAKHLLGLRGDANKQARAAQKAVAAAANAQGKAINKQGHLIKATTHAAVQQRDEAKKSVYVADRADKKRTAHESATDKRDADHQKKVITLLEAIHHKDTSVQVFNEAHGAKLTTTTSKSTRRRKR